MNDDTKINNFDAMLQLLTLTAEENYAHARDHEHLRAQITSILVAAGFILIALTFDKNLSITQLLFIVLIVFVVSAVNLRLVQLHTNRFKMHVAVADQAQEKIAEMVVGYDASNCEELLSTIRNRPILKQGSLASTWAWVAMLPFIAVILLGVISFLGV
ncbi:MAG: hypothetical protein AAF702_29265 [Chloroflexota bacterium]